MFLHELGIGKDLLRHWKESTAYKNDVYLLPVQLDVQAGILHLPALGVVLTVFAQGHEIIVVKVEGPVKGEHCRYLAVRFSVYCL